MEKGKCVLSLLCAFLFFASTFAYGGEAILNNDNASHVTFVNGNRPYPAVTAFRPRVEFWKKPEFWKKLNELKREYALLVKEVKGQFTEKMQELKQQITELTQEKNEALKAIKEGFAGELIEAKKEFIDKLMAAIKEGKFTEIVNIVKDYLNKVKELKAEEKEAIATVEEEFQTKIGEVNKQLNDLKAQETQAIDALKEAAKEEIQALCEEYNQPYSDFYLKYVFNERGWILHELKRKSDILPTLGEQLTDRVTISAIPFVGQMGGYSSGSDTCNLDQ